MRISIPFDRVSSLFRLSNEIEELSATAIAYKKMCQQIDKYWDKLFADPILVVTKQELLPCSRNERIMSWSSSLDT